MRISIICEDNTVIVDGVAVQVSCAELPSYVRAIQWDGEQGEIEFHRDANGAHQGNIKLSDISPYLYLVDRWLLARAEIQLVEHQKAVDAAERMIKQQEDEKLHLELQSAVFARAENEREAREAESAVLKQKVVDIEARQAELAARLADAELRLGVHP